MTISKVDVMNDLEDRFDGLKDGAKHLIDEAPGAATKIKDRAMNSIEYVGDQIKKHPIAALGIAFGAGFLAMRLIRR
ncbi:hypothetical protein BH11MYX1_BH11MYX1_37810 [soil metagenome]